MPSASPHTARTTAEPASVPPPTVSVTAPTAAIRADAVVVGLLSTKDGPRLAPGAEAIDAALGGRLMSALLTLGARGSADEVHRVPTLGQADFALVVAAGLGTADLGDDATDAEAVRRAVGAALRTLTTHRRVHVALDAPAGAIAEGAVLGSYAYTAYKSAPAKRALRSVSIAAPAPAKAGASAKAEVKRGTAVARAVWLARDLVNMPPNDLYPQTFAARAAELATAQGLEIEVLDEKALRRGRYGGVLAVGQGSARAPRLVRISYRPARARAHVALVGKGITFDSGGYNLKTANLTWMKSDMGGAAACIAAVLALAELKVPVSVTVTTPMAENMISGAAYRPSDVITLRDGTTLEIGDTDAEGRIVLADAIHRAAQDSPDRLIEISTLTGAQIVALGPRVIGAMGSDQWRDEVAAAATAAGEAVWPMPLPDELRGLIDSPVADLVNVPTERVAGMLLAGRFLGEFVPEGLPWVHLDIAGPSFNNGGARDYTPKGGTGAGVRAIIAAVQSLAD